MVLVIELQLKACNERIGHLAYDTPVGRAGTKYTRLHGRPRRSGPIKQTRRLGVTVRRNVQFPAPAQPGEVPACVNNGKEHAISLVSKSP